MNNYFCVMPFYGAEFNLKNRPTPCCLLPKDANIQKIQEEMLSQKRPVECGKCWQVEHAGRVSDRQLKNSAFDFYSDTDINQIEENCKAGNFSLQIVKLYTSNLCNSTCVTCGPMFSSKWQSVLNLSVEKNNVSEDVLNSINWKNIKMLTFVGGEPLYEKKNLMLLNELAEINDDCFISFVTNGSVTLNKQQKETFKKFKNLNVCLSIDGINKQFEYIRYPLKWESLVSNIEEYREVGAKLSVSFTISNLNILYYQEIVDWFETNSLPYNHNMVTYPPQFNLEVLPTSVKKNLPMITQPDKFDAELFSKFIKTVRNQDKLKNIDIKNYLPELSKIIDNFGEN